MKLPEFHWGQNFDRLWGLSTSETGGGGSFTLPLRGWL